MILGKCQKYGLCIQTNYIALSEIILPESIKAVYRIRH